MRTSKISMTNLTHPGKLHLRIDDAASKQARETTSQRKYRVKFKYNALKHFTFVIWEMLIFNIK